MTTGLDKCALRDWLVEIEKEMATNKEFLCQKACAKVRIRKKVFARMGSTPLTTKNAAHDDLCQAEAELAEARKDLVASPGQQTRYEYLNLIRGIIAEMLTQ